LLHVWRQLYAINQQKTAEYQSFFSHYGYRSGYSLMNEVLLRDVAGCAIFYFGSQNKKNMQLP
jgi:hypothetical protein